jgi:hypothetical protein
VCGRTILDGEQVHSYVSAGGRHEVCELCAERTGELGWLPADQDGAEEVLHAESQRKPRFFARLFARPERMDAEEDEGRAEATAPPPGCANHELDTERYDVEAEWPAADEPAPARARLKDLFAPGAAPQGRAAELPTPAAPASDAPLPDPAGRGMRPRRLQRDLSPTGRFEHAISRFNLSEAGRTVAGLTRTLGAPSVSVGDSAGAADEVRVTVAWELTWYQWGVDLGDELRPVYELAKGFEVTEIDSAARQWNASAHDGRIVMVAPSRREAAAGRPVPR